MQGESVVESQENKYFFKEQMLRIRTQYHIQLSEL